MSLKIIDMTIWIGFWLTLAYVAMTRFTSLVIAVRSLFGHFRRQRMDENEDFEMIMHSRHTIPISIIVRKRRDGLHHDQAMPADLIATIDSALEQDFPEFETVVVLARSEKELLKRINEKYKLKIISYFFSRVIPTAKVSMIFSSALYSNLKVVVADSDLPHDHWNVGINLARYRYVCPIESGVLLTRKALLQLVRPALLNPREIVAVSAAILTLATSETRLPKLPSQLRELYQTLASVRHSLASRLSLLANRSLHWTRDALIIWRRDLLLNIGGYRPDDLPELALRVHDHFCRLGEMYTTQKIVSTVAWQPPSRTLGQAHHRLGHWQQLLRRALWTYRGMAGRRTFGFTGLCAVPLWLLRSSLDHWIDLVVFFLLPIAALYGAISWVNIALLIAILVGTNLITSLIALLALDRSTTFPRKGSLILAIASTLIDYLGPRQLRSVEECGLSHLWKRPPKAHPAS